MYSWHLFLIYSASVRSIPFLSIYCVHLCMKCPLHILNSLVLPVLLFPCIALRSSLRTASSSLRAAPGNCSQLGISPFLFAFDGSKLALGLELKIPPWAPFLKSHFILFSKSHGRKCHGAQCGPCHTSQALWAEPCRPNSQSNSVRRQAFGQSSG